MKKITTLLALTFCINAKAQIITTVCGNGTLGYSGDGGQATAAELIHPDALAIDVIGNLYIADGNSNVIRKVNTAGIITTVAGNGTSGSSGNGGQATAAKLNNPSGVAVDLYGNLYIADSPNNNPLIRKVNTLGIISFIVGDTTGFACSAACGGPRNATDVGLSSDPRGLTIDSLGNLYFIDDAGWVFKVNTNTHIANFNVVGGYHDTTAFYGDGGQATAAGMAPNDVFADNSGNWYISGDYRVRKVNSAGIITTIVGNGTQGFSGDGGQATAAELNNPYGISIDPSGNLYVSDLGNNNIRMINTAGIISTVAGNGTSGFSGDGGQATAAEFNRPIDIKNDVWGNLYIVDQYNNRIRMITNVGQTTGINKVTNINSQISIYPNPSNGSFVIEPNSQAKQTMQMYDVNGKLVLSQTINDKTTIDASSLNEGVYNISLQSTEGVINKRIVIVK